MLGTQVSCVNADELIEMLFIGGLLWAKGTMYWY